jgi:DNA primase large subunit
MRKAVEELNASINVNHFGRLFLASMSVSIGLPREACAAFFVNAPDYDSAQTDYQTSQIYERGYTPAGCGKLKLNACCPVAPGENRLCDQEWMNHPLKYLRSKQRRRMRNEGTTSENASNSDSEQAEVLQSDTRASPESGKLGIDQNG